MPSYPLLNTENGITWDISANNVTLVGLNGNGTAGQVLTSQGTTLAPIFATPASSVSTLSAGLTAGNSAGSSQINMNSNKIINTTDPTNSQDVATKNYIDTILSGYMKQVKVERFTSNGTFTVPVGVTYAVAYILGGGGGVGITGSGTGGSSSVAFVSGTITATGGLGMNGNGFNIVNTAIAGTVNSGNGANVSFEHQMGHLGSGIFSQGQNGALITCGNDVAFGQTLAVVVGAGGTAGGSGAIGGSGYVYIEYY